MIIFQEEFNVSKTRTCPKPSGWLLAHSDAVTQKCHLFFFHLGLLFLRTEFSARFCKKFLLSMVMLIFSSLPAQEKITLRVANWGGAEEIQLEEEIAMVFMQRHPRIVVQIEPIPANYKEKILTYIASGAPPDVFLLDSVIIPALLHKGILLDLRPYLDSLQINPADYFPNVLKIFSRGESLYALPKDFTPIAMYYNKRLFDQAALPYPQNDWTWDDYLRLSRQITQDTNGDGIVDQFGTVFSNYFYLWQPWVWMNGGDIFDPSGNSAAGYFDSPPTVRALQFLIDLRVKHRVAPDDVALKTGTVPPACFSPEKSALCRAAIGPCPCLKSTWRVEI